MPVDNGNWRVGAAYDYFDDLKPEQVAFEFLRRDTEYEASFKLLPPDIADGSASAPAPFCARWGLRFRGQPSASVERSADHLVAPTQSADADLYGCICRIGRWSIPDTRTDDRCASGCRGKLR
jgi:hypothetical protein